MSYKAVMCCDDAVGLVVCFCIAAAIPSCVFIECVHCFVWCVCGFVLGLAGCGDTYIRYIYDERSSSEFCIIRGVVTLQWLVVSACGIKFRSVASCGYLDAIQ